MDATSGCEVARHFVLEPEQEARTPTAALAGAAIVHVAAGLAFWIFSAATTPPAPVDASQQVMTVTLVEPVPPQTPSASAISSEPSPTPPAPAAEFDIDVASSPAPSLALPDYLRLEDETAPLVALSPSTRAALARSLSCRSSLPDAETECPPALDYVSMAAGRGVTPGVFLDAELEPLPDGTLEFEVGPVAVSMTMYGPGLMPYVVTIKPRQPRSRD